jgi:hypothetical protein
MPERLTPRRWLACLAEVYNLQGLGRVLFREMPNAHSTVARDYNV